MENKTEFNHTPVLLTEVIDRLDIKKDGVYADLTVGGAGHSGEILRRLGEGGHLYCFDRDPDAAEIAKKRLSDIDTAGEFTVYNDNYSNIDKYINEKADGILIDCGISSYQIDTRGMSYHSEQPLDMRMSKAGLSAYDIVNEYSESEISDILWKYGEEKYSRSIAKNIVRTRIETDIKTTRQLAEVISNSVPFSYKRDRQPYSKTFQALRIAVNEEFLHLEIALEKAFSMLKPGGRLLTISFHSLEDRIVKTFYKNISQGCTCGYPKELCVCGKIPQGKILTKKPIAPSEKELAENNRSRSAKLRVICAVSE
ncbi:MAG: 16S rRNA (cytosine(1402)-N(4))-methyltransferase RsmH [Ruminococcus sp.]|jgi:16S rRNA (cytosine1402-N4)-methyltransferase|nr:16S rRNA (cytosine(1402)-N(4))-methyltransferase RsmH [Ruminococcus sp.]